MDSLQETLELMCYTARMSVGHVQVLHSTSYHGVPRPGETSEEVRKKSEKLTFLHGGFWTGACSVLICENCTVNEFTAYRQTLSKTYTYKNKKIKNHLTSILLHRENILTTVSPQRTVFQPPTASLPLTDMHLWFICERFPLVYWESFGFQIEPPSMESSSFPYCLYWQLWNGCRVTSTFTVK